MENKKVSFKQIRTAGVVLSLAIFLFVYLNVCDRYNQLTEEIKAETATVQNQITVANQLLEEQKDMDERIAKMDEKIDEILEKYPANQTIASNIMFLKTIEEANSGIDFLTVNLGDIAVYDSTTVTAEYPEQVEEETEDDEEGNSKWIQKSDETAETLPETSSGDTGASDGQSAESDTSEGDTSEDTTTQGSEGESSSDSAYDPSQQSSYMLGLKTTITLSFQGKYDAIKEFIGYLENLDTKVTIDEMSLAYDTTTDRINGSATISIYAITGSGKEFTEPNLSGVEIGRLRIFE